MPNSSIFVKILATQKSYIHYLLHMIQHLLKDGILAICCSLMVACDMIDYHPYDTKIDGVHNINQQNCERIKQQCANRSSIKFAVISDTQRWYDETKDVVSSINNRTDIDFVIHCGDISDFGVTKEFTLQRDILQGCVAEQPRGICRVHFLHPGNH